MHMLLDYRHLSLWYYSTPKYMVWRWIVLCHRPGGRTIQKWPSPNGLFKDGRVLTDYLWLVESSLFKVGRDLTDYSMLALPS